MEEHLEKLGPLAPPLAPPATHIGACQDPLDKTTAWWVGTDKAGPRPGGFPSKMFNSDLRTLSQLLHSKAPQL